MVYIKNFLAVMFLVMAKLVQGPPLGARTRALVQDTLCYLARPITKSIGEGTRAVVQDTQCYLAKQILKKKGEETKAVVQDTMCYLARPKTKKIVKNKNQLLILLK